MQCENLCKLHNEAYCDCLKKENLCDSVFLCSKSDLSKLCQEKIKVETKRSKKKIKEMLIVQLQSNKDRWYCYKNNCGAIERKILDLFQGCSLIVSRIHRKHTAVCVISTDNNNRIFTFIFLMSLIENEDKLEP